MMGKKEGTPLEVLATRTSAFKSGNTLLWWEKILYQCKSHYTQEIKINIKKVNFYLHQIIDILKVKL
jgi:hypothetical protein